jgi:hypothetical protein
VSGGSGGQRGGQSSGRASRSTGRQGGQLDCWRRRRLGRQVNPDSFFFRLNFAGFLLGWQSAARNVGNILSHKISKWIKTRRAATERSALCKTVAAGSLRFSSSWLLQFRPRKTKWPKDTCQTHIPECRGYPLESLRQISSEPIRGDAGGGGRIVVRRSQTPDTVISKLQMTSTPSMIGEVIYRPATRRGWPFGVLLILRQLREN